MDLSQSFRGEVGGVGWPNGFSFQAAIILYSMVTHCLVRTQTIAMQHTKYTLLSITFTYLALGKYL